MRASRFFHWTVVPASTSMRFGRYADPLMRARTTLGCAARGAPLDGRRGRVRDMHRQRVWRVRERDVQTGAPGELLTWLAIGERCRIRGDGDEAAESQRPPTAEGEARRVAAERVRDQPRYEGEPRRPLSPRERQLSVHALHCEVVVDLPAQVECLALLLLPGRIAREELVLVGIPRRER